MVVIINKLKLVKNKLSNIRIKKSTFVIAIISCAMVGSFAAILIVNNNKLQNGTVGTPAENFAKASDVAQKSGAESGQKVLDDKLKQTNDSKIKAELYLNKATLASTLVSKNDYTKALEYAYESEKLNATANSALAIATMEEMKNNITNAIKYYKIYLERTPKPTSGSSDGYAYYVSHVKELESKNK